MEKRTFRISESLNSHPLQRFVAVTGIPRGGTTLLGSLISRLNNSYCLSEPMAIEEQLHLSSTPVDFLERTRRYFQKQHRFILETGKSVNRIRKDGLPVTNYFRRLGDNSLEHDYIEAEEVVDISGEDFTLAIKHNAQFLSILPLLCSARDISVIGIIRHPIPTIMSWRSLDLPVSYGRLPSGEKFWPELHRIACSDCELLMKQVMIYELIASRLLKYRNQIHLLCYESLVKDPKQIGSLLHQEFRCPDILVNSNRNQEYNWEEVREIRTLLKCHAPNTISLYSLHDIDSPASF